MLSIHAVRGLPRLRAPGIVPCVISFSRQLPCFLMSVQLHSRMLRLITACLPSVGVCIRDLRIGRLRLNRIRIESGVTIRIRIESRIESAVYDIS